MVKNEPLFLFEFRKRKSTLREMSFQGNKKNKIDENLDKTLIKPKIKSKKKTER